MANLLSGFLSNVLSGLSNPKGNLGDFSHAAKLYNSQSFRLAPKTKFLYHVVFNFNPDVKDKTSFRDRHQQEVALLVRQVDLPRFKVTLDTVQQYNRKKQVQTRLDYDPISITFHDDNLGVTTALWSLYYGYYFADSAHGNSAGSKTEAVAAPNVFQRIQDRFFPGQRGSAPADNIDLPGYKRKTITGNANEYNLGFRYGLDNDQYKPFFTSIQIFQLSRHQYQSFTLVNPIIESWQHDTLDNSNSADTSTNKMTIKYEAVIYGQGPVQKDMPKNFAKVHYDNSPSPLTLLGGGGLGGRLFGRSGLLNNGLGLLGDVASLQAFRPENLLGTIVKGANIYNRAKDLTINGIRQEGFNIITNAIGSSTGINVNGVSNTLFPKTSGAGQTSTVTKAVPIQQTQTIGPLPRESVTNFLASRPGSLTSITKTALFAKERSLGDLNEINTQWNSLSRSAQLEFEERALQKIVSGDPDVQSQYQQLLRQG